MFLCVVDIGASARRQHLCCYRNIEKLHPDGHRNVSLFTRISTHRAVACTSA